MGDNKNIPSEVKATFKYIKDFNDIAFRILLIDDKIGKFEGQMNRFISLIDEKQEEQNAIESEDGNSGQKTVSGENHTQGIEKIEIKSCPKGCDSCPIIGTQPQPCKLCTIKKLMKFPNGSDDSRNDYHYWKQMNIKTYFCPTVIKDFIRDENFYFLEALTNYPKRINVYSEGKDIENGELNIKCDFAPNIYEEIENDGIKEKTLNVQIVGVRDVRTALLLMSKYKFDMIFCDYLLDKKADGSGERDYIEQLFDFLSFDYKDKIKNEQDLTKKKRLEVLEQLRRDVLDNRGPLDKLWIMPITGFNQTFIQDLYRNQIELIGHKWNISNGADPITTPWQFLHHLNKFIELQLKSCVYEMKHLLLFVKYTCEDLQDLNDKKEKNNNGNKKKLGFFEFQSFMGSEYANFMRRYGNRHLIQRDAVCEKDGNTENKSVFATYVWNAFYVNRENRDVIELNRLIQRFLYQASTMHNDRSGQQRLEETFGQLCLFIDTNLKVRETIEKEEDFKDDKLENELEKLRILMDELTDNQHGAE